MSFDLQIINGDFVIKNGDLNSVTGKNKLIQDILKVCLTEQGANIYASWYGSALSKSVIGSVLDENITLDLAKSQIQNSLENLKKMQEMQAADASQQVLPSELIAAIKNISVNRNQSDPRIIEISITVMSKAFEQATATFTMNNF